MLNRLKSVYTLITSLTVYRFVKEVFAEFVRDKGTLFAAAISFFGILSFVPLITIAFGVLGYVIGSREIVLQRVVAFIGDWIPVSPPQLEKYLTDLSQQAGTLSIIGLIGLLWVGTQVFVIIQQVMNIAIGSSDRRIGIIKGRGFAVILVLVTGVLFALSLGLTWILNWAQGINLPYVNLHLLWVLLNILAATLISALAFTFVYKFSPADNIGTSGPLLGGITAGILFEIAKYGFRWYVTHIANFNRIYGSLGSIIVLVVWIYYAALIAVIGAEIASVYARWKGDITHQGR